MLYLALGAAVLLALMWGARGRKLVLAHGWRAASGVLAVGAFAGAALSLIRGGLALGAVLFVVGLGLAMGVRVQAPRKPAVPTTRMSAAEARALLGVSAEATAEEIQAAYLRLMRRAHPDAGGTSGLAAQLNMARETLLGR